MTQLREWTAPTLTLLHEVRAVNHRPDYFYARCECGWTRRVHASSQQERRIFSGYAAKHIRDVMFSLGVKS